MSAEANRRQRFGRYETLFPIAAGGMAEVYAARALGEGGFQKLVALKRMRPELAADARFVAMFLDEGRLAANFTSPNVVSTLDLGRAQDDSLYLVMELVTGVSLQVLMNDAAARSAPIPQAIAVDILAQAAAGLHDAHEARSAEGEPLSIVHRDCSPHNVLVDVSGQVKITDFGVAKAMQRQTQSLVGEMKGKLSYLSPEQARGEAVDRRTDIFILGVVAWEVFAGRQLFDANHPVEALYKIAMMPIPPLSEVSPSVGPELSAAIARALERSLDARYPTAAAFGSALTDAIGGRPPPRSQIGAFVRAHGGEALERLQLGVRRALGKKGPASIPPPSDDAAPADVHPPAVPAEALPPPPSEGPAPRGPRRRTRRMGSAVAQAGVAIGDAPTDPSRETRGRLATEALPQPSMSSPEPPQADGSPSRRGTLALLPTAEPAALPDEARAVPASISTGAGGTRTGIKLALAATLLVSAGSAAALGAYWYDRAPATTSVEPIEAAARRPSGAPARRLVEPDPAPSDPEAALPAPPPTPIEAEPAGTHVDPEPTVAQGEPASVPPSDPSVPVPPAVPGTRPRPRPRTPAHVSGTEPPALPGTPVTPIGDRASTFGEIPWEQPRRTPPR